jgi:ferrous iron transport protein B
MNTSPDKKPKTVALIGNPNSGKSSLFNHLTGLRQDVSNFPGVTVDKKSAIIHLAETTLIRLIDFPGTYSFFPNSVEEKIVIESLVQYNGAFRPDLVVYVADVTQLERHMLLATQIRDLGIPMIFVLNMIDVAQQNGQQIDIGPLEAYLKVPIVQISVRQTIGLDTLRLTMFGALFKDQAALEPLYKFSTNEAHTAQAVQRDFPQYNLYQAKLLAHHSGWLTYLSDQQRTDIQIINQNSGFQDLRQQVQETMIRFESIVPIAKRVLKSQTLEVRSWTDRVDDYITHRVWGPLIFFFIMLLVFQAIYSLATFPMDLIEQGFAQSGHWLSTHLPTHWMSDLAINGIWAGLGGVIVFVPQIAILFLMITFLEESGYMSRAVFMFDNVMRVFGMNGRSMVSLISSAACAIPAIMATRTISNQRERLITIMVSPLISCSARLPVYAILIGFVVNDDRVFGFLNRQGLAFMGLYLLGILGVMVSSLLLKPFIKETSGSFLMMELPNYKAPLWTNILLTVKEKVMAFIIGAGKVIVLISVVLWFMAAYGPSAEMKASERKAEMYFEGHPTENLENLKASYKLEASYMGQLGRFIEPVIRPLGFDWKIGIALITSFAAREVFVGTMATIYSVGDADDESTIRQKMSSAKWADTGEKIYTPATALSLLVFYVFALQCMSTLAVTKRETASWKWPIIQFLFMGVLAYFSSFIVYQTLS